MNYKVGLLVVVGIGLGGGVFAQGDKEERKEELQEKRIESKAKAKDKADYNIFHRQMLALPEYSQERRKLPNLQKANKMPVKIMAIVDTAMDDEAKSKTLNGTIVENIGDNTVNLYDVVFDRAQQKIVSVKHTAEAVEADKTEKDDYADEKKTDTKKTVHKKTKTDDDDDDEDNPVKGKEKDKDEDKE